MTPLMLAVLASFLLGAFGYVLVQYWFLPIGRYRKVKRRVARNLIFHLQPDKDNLAGEDMEALLVSHSETAAKLTECFHADLPAWYKIRLRSKKEYPDEAAQHLMKLANTKNPDHARARAEKVKALLGI